MGLYVLSRLLFVCIQFDIQAASGTLRAVTSVVCLCTVRHPGSEWGSTCCHAYCLSVYSLTSKQRVGLYLLSCLLFVCVQFDIQAASGALRAVTFVVFFDGPKEVFVDYTPVFLDGDTSRLADSCLRGNGLRIVDTGLPGDSPQSP